ncbi:MAG: cyanophycinase [Cyclobacteriaceae bacterium]|nr:cyanophycinase [Flammeovirgaceae bacterium]
MSIRILSPVFLLAIALSCEQPTTCCGQAGAGIGLVGDSEDVTSPTAGGTVLMGGSTDVDEAIRWMLQRSGGGDFVVIRASGSTGYNDYIFGLGTVNSVETLLINTREKALLPETGKRIREAEALFIAGGDQANYVKFWANTEVSAAIQYLINEKKIPIGGTSAGCAILSDYIFDAQQGTVTSSEALANPYVPAVSLSKSFIQIPALANVIADQHYTQRGREGRHVAFMARLQKDLGVNEPRGIGVDEQTAVCIAPDGQTTVFGIGKAYFLQGKTMAEDCSPGKKLHWHRNQQAVQVHVVSGSPSGTEAFPGSSWPSTGTFWFVESGVLNKTP